MKLSIIEMSPRERCDGKESGRREWREALTLRAKAPVACKWGQAEIQLHL